jgi:hypothetical protein
MAPQSAIARFRSGPASNEEVMIARDDAASSAPPRPCTARAPINTLLDGARPPATEAMVNVKSATMKVRRCPKTSVLRPASIKKPAKKIA